jgi:hypothetical protein
MAYKNTIANNHLSSLASKGRYGDTQIAKTSKGELWHVNPQEKSLMTMYGMEGERMVDAMGSGTTNPQTGLEEKFDPLTWIAIGSAVIGAVSSATGGRAKELQAGADVKSAEQGIDRLDTVEEGLEKGKQARQLVVSQDYDFESGKFAAQVGMKKEDLQLETASAIQKSGLATPGTVGQKASQVWDRIQDFSTRGREGLIAKLGKSMGDIERWYEGEKARISGERQKFENIKDLAEQQGGSWYLGKHLGQASRSATKIAKTVWGG